MNTSSLSSGKKEPRDAAYWAQQISTLKVARTPTGALNLNVEGREALSPLQGFGQMWQKTYQVRLQGIHVEAAEVIKTWKERFPTFWPKGNRFYAPLIGIVPGEVALLNLASPGGMLSTGVVVLYADDESFTLMTPQGHMFAGWITFSAYEEDGSTVAQAHVLMRADDPLYELGMILGGHKAEDKFWQYTLTSLAAYLGVDAPKVRTEVVCLDPRVQWTHFWNIRHNAAMRTGIYRMLTPVRWMLGHVRR